jgi:precorrin-4 methylase
MKDELAPLVRPGAVEVVSPSLMGGQYLGKRPEEFSGEARDRAIKAHEALTQLKMRVKTAVAEGKTIVFADNGDPMLFSPWNWVPQQLAEFQPIVVPGVSSFHAGSAVLRHSVAGSVTLSSGENLGIRGENGRLVGTLVFFTHRTRLEELVPRLQARYPRDTPAAIVGDASYPSQMSIHGTLGTIADLARDKKPPHLYLLFVGDKLGQGSCCDTKR